MGWKKLESVRVGPGRPNVLGLSIVIYPGTNTMYASSMLRAAAGRVDIEINDDRKLLRITPSTDGVDIHRGQFNFRPLRHIFSDIEENVVINLVEADGHYMGRIQ